MMPHLGVTSTVYRDAAWSIFDKDCLVRIGTSIAAAGTGKLGEHCMTVELTMPDGSNVKEEMNFGDIKLVPLRRRTGGEGHHTPRERHSTLGKAPASQRKPQSSEASLALCSTHAGAHYTYPRTTPRGGRYSTNGSRHSSCTQRTPSRSW